MTRAPKRWSDLTPEVRPLIEINRIRGGLAKLGVTVARLADLEARLADEREEAARARRRAAR